MNLTTAKLRVKAKKFKKSIPTGMALRLPDSLLDNLSDEEAHEFFNILSQLGVTRRSDCLWERSN